MQVFESAYASSQEVKTADAMVRAILETHWPQMFGLGGNCVLGACMDVNVLTLATALVEPSTPREATLAKIVRETQIACDALGVPLHVEFNA
jgi:hypothetical protein